MSELEDFLDRTAQHNARLVQRASAAATFAAGFLLLVALGVWLLVMYFEPCPEGALCAMAALRDYPGRPEGPIVGEAIDVDDADPADDDFTTAQAPAPEAQPFHALFQAMLDSHAIGVASGHAEGYVEGARSGRLAGFVWGLGAGAALVCGAMQLGLFVGKP